MPVLSARDHEAFRRDGFVRVREAFPRAVALAMQDELWAELESSFSIVRADRGTWRAPPKGLAKAKHSSRNREIVGSRVRAVIDELLGVGRWDEPSHWGGFLITFPTPSDHPWDLPSAMWHWDGPLSDRTLDDPKGLLIFSFFSTVAERGGGTLLLRGSARLVDQFRTSLTPDELASKHSIHRQRFLAWHPYLQALGGKSPQKEQRVATFMTGTQEVDGVATGVVELTGGPGDVVFCHPWLVHAPAGLNHRDQPRFMRGKFFW